MGLGNQRIPFRGYNTLKREFDPRITATRHKPRSIQIKLPAICAALRIRNDILRKYARRADAFRDFRGEHGAPGGCNYAFLCNYTTAVIENDRLRLRDFDRKRELRIPMQPRAALCNCNVRYRKLHLPRVSLPS